MSPGAGGGPGSWQPTRADSSCMPRNLLVRRRKVHSHFGPRQGVGVGRGWLVLGGGTAAPDRLARKRGAAIFLVNRLPLLIVLTVMGCFLVAPERSMATYQAALASLIVDRMVEGITSSVPATAAEPTGRG